VLGQAHLPGLVGQVLAVAAEQGGAPAEAIDRAATTLRDRAALRAERIAHASSARLSTRVMTVLPIGFTALVAATHPGVRAVLLTTQIGWACLGIGLALNLTGRAWAKRVSGA
jgi:Flp pilus assembly protein TadB